ARRVRSLILDPLEELLLVQEIVEAADRLVRAASMRRGLEVRTGRHRRRGAGPHVLTAVHAAEVTGGSGRAERDLGHQHVFVVTVKTSKRCPPDAGCAR